MRDGNRAASVRSSDWFAASPRNMKGKARW
jgi:hypothetical protein